MFAVDVVVVAAGFRVVGDVFSAGLAKNQYAPAPRTRRIIMLSNALMVKLYLIKRKIP